MEFFKKIINEVLKSDNNVKEVKYFSTSGKELTTGHHYQKGAFIKECMDNRNSFNVENIQYLINEDLSVTEAIHPEQYGLSDYKGGVIVFSTDVNALNISKNAIKNWFMSKLKSYKNRLFVKSKLGNIINKYNSDGLQDYIGAFSIGKFFSGRYVGDNGEIFDEKSISIEVNGISSKGLIFLAEDIANEFQQETVLLKDLNNDKIYLVDSDKTGSYDTSKINKKT